MAFCLTQLGSLQRWRAISPTLLSLQKLSLVAGRMPSPAAAELPQGVSGRSRGTTLEEG